MNEFLGVGWSFPVAADDSGRIGLARHEELIRQAIWIILDTVPGERVMRPDFGCGIHDLVFTVNSAATSGRISAAVRQALIRWEPRIDTLEVAATTDADQPERLLIRIDYRVRATNNRFNLTYPFYLEY